MTLAEDTGIFILLTRTDSMQYEKFQCLTVYDNDILEPDPVRQGGLVRQDMVCTSVEGFSGLFTEVLIVF